VTNSSIAIDGPVASGKSAVGARVAERLGYQFIDTGAMYRAITWLALQERLDIHDERALEALAASARLEISGAKIRLNGIDVTDKLRSSGVAEAVSLVSRAPGVRRAMVNVQRALAATRPTVMVGRDIGTVVLPNATLKVFLEASAPERVRRRHAELLASGASTSEEDVSREVELRDAIDSNRDISPLKPAPDAIMIDTSELSLEDVVAKVLRLHSC
jgi:cytidylate kinase